MDFGSEGYSLGTAYGRIVLSLDDSAVQNARQSIGGGLQDLGGAISSIGSSLTQLTAPVLAFGLTGLKAASDFDTVINQIRVFGELGPQDLERVRQAALKWGADTKFSALDASAGMLDLLKSGQSVEQAMATMPAVLNLAGAGNLNLAQAAGITSSALAQFRLKAEDAGRVADALSRAANASRAEVGDLGLAMGNVGPVAAQYGLSIEDASATLAVFAQNGIMGAEGGTLLKTVLTQMTRPTEEAAGAWKKLGLSLYDANGNTRDFNTVLGELDTALDKLPVEEQNEIMYQLAGSFGITGLNALRAAGGIGAMRDQMAAAPDAATIAAEFMNTFAGKVESLTGSIQTLQIEALTPLMNDVLAPMVDKLIGVVNSLTAWIQANPELAGQITQILAVLVVVGPTLLIIGKAVSAVGGLFSGLGTILGLVLSPIGLIIGAAALLFLAFQTNFLGIRDILQPVIETIVNAVQLAVMGFSSFTDILNDTGSVVDAIVGSLSSGIANFLVGLGVIQNPEQFLAFRQAIEDALGGVVSFIQEVVIPIVERFVGLLVDFWTAIQPGLQAFANWVIADVLPLVVDFFNTILRPAVEGIVNMLMDIWEVVSPALSALFNWFMAEGLPWITDALRWFMENVLQPAITLLQGIWEAVGPVLQDVFDWFVTTALPKINEAVVWFKDNVLQPAVDILEGLWIVIEPVLAKVYDWFVTTALPKINEAVVWFKDNIITPLVTLISGLWEAIRPSLEKVYNWFRDSFQWIGDTFIKPVVDFIQKIIDGVGNALRELEKLGGGGGVSVEGSGGTPTAASLGIQFRDSGGAGMADVPYLIGRGAQPELFIPNSNGTFIPNADKLLGAGGGGGDTIILQVPIEMLRDEPNLERNARTFAEKFADAKRSMG